MTAPTTSRVSFRVIPSPIGLALGLSLFALLATWALDDPPEGPLDIGGRLAVLLPLVFLATLMVLDSIHRVELEDGGIRVSSLANLLLGVLAPRKHGPVARASRITWASVEAVELRIPQFQSPFRRNMPRGWLLAASPGRTVRIPLGHPQLPRAIAILREFVHPFFLHLPSKDWAGKIPPRLALERMLRSILFNPSAPADFIAEAARACVLWGNPARAERLMDMALSASPPSEALLEDYFRLMKRLGKRDKAQHALQRLMSMRQSPLDLIEMAELQHSQGDLKGATEYLLQAAQKPPTSDLAHFLLGCLYVQRDGLHETALDQWKKGLEQARHPQMLGKLGENYRYHRALLTRPDFFHHEHRRLRFLVWGNRLGIIGAAAVLAGLGWWQAAPGSAVPFPGESGALLIFGGILMVAGLVLRRAGRDRFNGQ